MKEAALALAKRSLAVFPLKPRDKLPITEHGCKDATTSSEQIEEWWTRWPNANIGIATGSASNLCVIDIDGNKGEAALREVEKRHCTKFPETIEVKTGKGRHLYYRLPLGTPVIRNSVKTLGPDLDVRGEGGYVVAPPSIHPNGQKYAWELNTAQGFTIAPAWLITLLASPPVAHIDARRPADHWRRVAHDGAAEGARNTTTASLTGYLLRLGLDAHTTADIVLGWNTRKNRPPLPDDEVIQIVRSIAARELARLEGR